jgi:hypothetical protein
MWEEYVVRWNHFVDYVRLLQPNEASVIKILIGEAPPFYRASVKEGKRSYFYNPCEIKYTPWFGALYKKFVYDIGKDMPNKNKADKLKALASEGILLIDLFPFPIIQSTEVRMEVTGEFSNWIGTYFKCFLKALLDYLKQKLVGVKFQFGMAATKYAATQFLLGSKTREVLSKFEEGLLLKNPICEPKFLKLIQFHEDVENIKNDTLYLPIFVQKKNGSFDEKYHDYFEFVFTIVYSDDWSLFEGDSIGKFVKEKMNKEAFDELNKILRERQLLPIYSADSVMISLEEGVFFNSK